MSQLPPITPADNSPDWLPAGWIAQSTVLKSGREIRSYTHLRTGKKLSSKDDVLQYIEMEKIHGIRYSETEMLKIPKWLPDNWTFEERTGRTGKPCKVYTNLSTGYKCYYKGAVLRSLQYAEHDTREQKKIEEVAYEHPRQLPANPKMKLRPRKRGLTKEKHIEPPVRRRKLKSRGTRRHLIVDEDTNYSGEDALSEADTDDEADSSEVKLIVSHLADCLAHEDLQDIVVDSDDQTKGTLGMTGSSGAEINVECQGALTYTGTYSLPENDLNDMKNGKDGLLMSGSDSTKGDIIQESECKSKESIKVQALQEEQPRPEERANEPSKLLFFPFKSAPADKDHELAFDTSTAKLSAEDIGNTSELASKSRADNPQGKCTRCTNKRKKSIGTSLSKKAKKKDTKMPCRSTDQPEELETPNKVRGKRSDRPASEKASGCSAADQNERWGLHGSLREAYWPPDFACKNLSRTGTSRGEGSSRQQMDHWPDLCVEFVFECLTRSARKEDDSVIRGYLEEHVTAAGTADIDIPLPDFGLPSFAHIKLASV